MATIVLATFGSLGDLHPFLGLGMTLAARGHIVRIATHACYRAHIVAPLQFHAVRPDLPNDQTFHNRFMDPRQGVKFVHKEFLSPAINDSYQDLRAAVAGADLLVSQTLMLAAPLVAATQKIKWLSAVFQPFTLYSAYDPPPLPGLPLIKAPKRPWQIAFNRRLLSYAERFTESWVAPVLHLRDRLGVPPYGHPMFSGQHAPQGTLALFSPLLSTPQPDWPARTVQTGAIAYQSLANDPELPSAVLEFLQAGEPPLIFTLGSAASRSYSRFFQIAVVIARRLRRRALLVGDVSANPLPPGIMRCGAIPYAAIFPYAAAIIQPGGIGTSMAAIKAQRPQLLVPFAHDQADNARRLKRAGLAAVLPINRFTAPAATKTLRDLLDESALPARLAGAVATGQDGAEAAADVIERVLAA